MGAMPFVIKNSEELSKQAAPVAQNSELLDIRTFQLHAEILDIAASGELKDIMSLDTTLGVAREGTNLSYHFEHELILKGKNGQDAVKIQVHLAALFRFPAENEPGGEVTEDSLIAFGQTTAHFAVHPYLRVAVSDLTARLGCPPVTLALLKR